MRSALTAHASAPAAKATQVGLPQVLCTQRPSPWLKQCGHRWCMHATDTESETATSSTPTLDERDELQEQMEEFLRQQAESESGAYLCTCG